jgi:hypothetical protein
VGKEVRGTSIQENSQTLARASVLLARLTVDKYSSKLFWKKEKLLLIAVMKEPEEKVHEQFQRKGQLYLERSRPHSRYV